MKREIKFRGKSIKSGDWEYGSYINLPDSQSHHIVVYGTYKPHIDHFEVGQVEVDPSTVGQYTGLKDKNGAEIYEGDILTMDSWNPNIVEVCFDDGAFCLKQENIPYMSDIHYVHHAGQPQASIVCNIHDNPELLKGGGK